MTRRDSTHEDDPQRTPPWDIEKLRPEEIAGELRATERWVERLRGLWGRRVPACWYFHQDLGLALIAARIEWAERIEKGGARSIYAFLGDDLKRLILEPLASPIGDGENTHRVPGSEAHRKVNTRDLGDSVEAFLDSPWFGWIWCGVTPPAPAEGHGDV